MRDAVRISEFDVSADAALAFARDEALGGVALLRGSALGFVSPSAEGRGAGSRLLAWVEQRAIEGRRGCHRQRIGAANNSAHVLLDRHGYAQLREVRHMSIELVRTVEVRAPPLCRATGSGVGVVDLLAVDPALRRQGLGRALLLGALRTFAGAGLTEGRLDVAADNPPAVALYASVGMSVAQRTHVFEKPLNRD